MKSLKLIILAVVATTTFANASVSDAKPVSVSAEVGTLGYGANVAWDVNDKAKLQVGINGGDVVGMIPCDCVKKRRINDVRFDLDSSFSNPYVGVQIRPMDNALTVGAGVIHVGSDKLNFVSTETTRDRKVVAGKDNKTYIVKGGAKVEGDVKFKNKLAPYLTVGVHPNQNKKVSVFGEVGAVYVGGVKTNITTKGKFMVNGSEVDTKDIEDQAVANKVAQLENDINEELKERVDNNIRSKDKFYPVVKVGVTTRF